MTSSLKQVEEFIAKRHQIDSESNDVAYKLIKDFILSMKIPLLVLNINPEMVRVARCRIHKEECLAWPHVGSSATSSKQ